MTKSGFGERLKRERELRGVSREEICAATRISTRFLKALETEQWGILPGGIFNRGFVRAVARFLGLDEDDLLAEYDLAMSEQNSSTEPSLTPPVPQPPARPRAGRFLWIGAACMVVLLGGSWLGWRWQYKHHRSVGQAANRSNSAWSFPEAGQPQETAPRSSAAENAGTASAALPASPSPSAPDFQGLNLKIEAGKETSVSVSADGSKIFEGSMIAGQSRTFTAHDAIDISAKDAGALLLELNGQTLAPLGPPGQPGNVTLTRSDLKPAGGGAD